MITVEDVSVPFQRGGLFGIKDVTNRLSKNHVGSLKASTGAGVKPDVILGEICFLPSLCHHCF